MMLSIGTVSSTSRRLLKSGPNGSSWRVGHYADLPTRNQISHAQESHEQVEAFKFTITDNPGLIEDASDNVGLGHSFLQSRERSHALVYVVDLSGPAPWDELRMLQEELEKYKCGMRERARMVIANKADLLASEVIRKRCDLRDSRSLSGRCTTMAGCSMSYQPLASLAGKFRSWYENCRLTWRSKIASRTLSIPTPSHISQP
jgi:hypothetical protein